MKRAISGTKSDGYRHSTTLVLISIAWVVGAVPIVTIGPATVGAYTAVLSVLQDGEIDWKRVYTTTRRTVVFAVSWTVLVAALVAGSGLYLHRFLVTGGAIAGALTVVGLYATLFVAIVTIATLVAVADGIPPQTALKRGYVWTVRHPTLSLTAVVLSAVLLAVSLLFTVAFVLLFAGVVGTFHVQLVLEDVDSDRSVGDDRSVSS